MDDLLDELGALMGTNSSQAGASDEQGLVPPDAAALAKAAENLGAALGNLGEADRYRLLASLLSTLAESNRNADNGRFSADQAKEMARKLQALDKTRAELEDQLRGTRDDLRDREGRLTLEQNRVTDLHARLEAQRGRLESLEKDRRDLESQLVARNAELHEAEKSRDDLNLKAQRAAGGGEERRQIQALEQECIQLRAQLATANVDGQQIREEKNGRIAELEEELRAAKSAGAQSASLLPEQLWNRLIAANLAAAGSLPTPQSLQRVVDALIELAGFVGEFDKMMRVFLTRYARRRKELNMAWQGYTGGDGIQQILVKVLSPGMGITTIQGLRGKLKICNRWAQASMASTDATFESLSDMLRDQLRQFAREQGNKGQVTDFIDKGGHDNFQASVGELQSKKLEDVFSLGV